MVTGNDAEPSTFVFGPDGSKLVTLGAGTYTVTEEPPSLSPGAILRAVFSGACKSSNRQLRLVL